MIFNRKSGKGFGEALPEKVQAACDERGIHLSLYSGATFEQFEKQIEAAIENAKQDGGVVLAAGGDGTIRGVIQKAANQNIRLGVIPIGTFNFFARNYNIPLEPEESIRLALSDAEARPIPIASINDHVFLVNASMGIYSQAIKDREQSTRRFGRNRLVVIISTLFSFFNKQRLLNIDMVVDGVDYKTQTSMVFIGTNSLQLENLNMKTAECMKRGSIAVILLKPLRYFEILRIIFRGFTKTLENEANVESFCATSLIIYTRRQTHDIALDGELFHLASPLKINAKSHSLNLVYTP
ncbi:MAG: diacylglycerol kinase family protein [Bdellovibrionota bacterium]